MMSYTDDIKETGRKGYLLSLSQADVVENLIEREKMLLSLSYMLESSEKENVTLKKQLTKDNNKIQNSERHFVNLENKLAVAEKEIYKLKSNITNFSLEKVKYELMLESLNTKLNNLFYEKDTLTYNYNSLHFENIELKKIVNRIPMKFSHINNICTNIYCFGTNCPFIHENNPMFQQKSQEWTNMMYQNFTSFRSHCCNNSNHHRHVVCTFSHSPIVLSKTTSKKDEYVPAKVDLDKCLPTSRENDIKDIGLNGDSLHDPKITKEQLDVDLDKYNKSNNHNNYDKYTKRKKY